MGVPTREASPQGSYTSGFMVTGRFGRERQIGRLENRHVKMIISYACRRETQFRVLEITGERHSVGDSPCRLAA